MQTGHIEAEYGLDGGRRLDGDRRDGQCHGRPERLHRSAQCSSFGFLDGTCGRTGSAGDRRICRGSGRQDETGSRDQACACDRAAARDDEPRFDGWRNVHTRHVDGDRRSVQNGYR